MKTGTQQAESTANTMATCDRCGADCGECRWTAASKPARRARPEIRLCLKCTDALATFIVNGHSVQKALKFLRQKGVSPEIVKPGS
jgi:hypothetical protein